MLTINVTFCVTMRFVMLVTVFLTASDMALAADNSNQEPLLRSASVVTNTQLLKQPKYQSDVIAEVNKNQQLKVAQRQRAWYFISLPENTNQSEQLTTSGWISMLAVRFLSMPKREGDLGIGALYQSASKDTLPTVSTGVRGFDEQELKKAKADFSQLALLKQYQASRKATLSFAKQGQLSKHNTEQAKE
ncbi:hypothetical protein [Litorilituus sediminis]|uniref:SH3 domain-containing protein n=1 Tax=Litorilituus sediminis TaxID=718192 RepID=A0A4P6P6I3_9GAMM|nr:hypothetical protein [Litorilituus sediminis]QBG34985.1 hypothetical protein EMK97_04155 [Litorilituus sediminis]